MLVRNLRIAVNELLIAKDHDPQIRGRIETCVNKESVKLYIIKKEEIQEVVTVDKTIVTRRVVNKEEK